MEKKGVFGKQWMSTRLLALVVDQCYLLLLFLQIDRTISLDCLPALPPPPAENMPKDAIHHPNRFANVYLGGKLKSPFIRVTKKNRKERVGKCLFYRKV